MKPGVGRAGGVRGALGRCEELELPAGRQESGLDAVGARVLVWVCPCLSDGSVPAVRSRVCLVRCWDQRQSSFPKQGWAGEAYKVPVEPW